MSVDLQDSEFHTQTSEKHNDQINLTGTLFVFEDGSKMHKINGQTSIKVKVDNDSLLEKYKFVEQYAPRMWLSEKENGWWPSDHQTYFDNMKAFLNADNKIQMTTKIPLSGPRDQTQ